MANECRLLDCGRQSIVINAPAGDKNGTEVGAKRVLNQAFRETLLEFSDDDRTLAYSIDDGPSPVSPADVSNYVGRIAVSPITEGGGTFVAWSSSWEKNDQATAQFCNGIYVALLNDMKKAWNSVE